MSDLTGTESDGKAEEYGACRLLVVSRPQQNAAVGVSAVVLVRTGGREVCDMP